jgi:hypothetical protein
MSQENPISKQPLIRYVNRQQMSWRVVDVEKLIGEDDNNRVARLKKFLTRQNLDVMRISSLNIWLPVGFGRS